MTIDDIDKFISVYEKIRANADGECCFVAPSPKIATKMRNRLKQARNAVGGALSANIGFNPQTRVGFNDGLSVPGPTLSFGAPALAARNVALEKAQLKGVINVAVVLVEFPDKKFSNAAKIKKYFDDLFFSQNVVATGSVKEYYKDVTRGAVDMSGKVVGPYMMPKNLKSYANGDSGTGNAAPNARTMARDAANASLGSINYKSFDNNHDGFVEAFVVVHAGSGAEQTGSVDDIWSHKWVLTGQGLKTNGVSIFAYLTIPEDALLGVCAHELGHLVFGFPDLYDTTYVSEGVGNWCLMGGGSWLNNGKTPAHPSAWCKHKQSWVPAVNVKKNGKLTIKDVKSGGDIYRLWRHGAAGDEYFLIENRQKSGYDKFLPGGGLLIWRIDESVSDNDNRRHPKVGLLQADGKQDLENAKNRGDAGDPYPGSSNATVWDKSTTPSSLSYGDIDTEVSLRKIRVASGGVSADATVSSVKQKTKAKKKKTKKSTKKRATAATRKKKTKRAPARKRKATTKRRSTKRTH